MKEAFHYMKELDELTMKILKGTSCKDLDGLSMLKLMEHKEPMISNITSLTFTTHDDTSVDMRDFLSLVSDFNMKLVSAQAAHDSTEDRT